MERKEFKQRLKGLLAWVLVMILMINSVQGGFLSVYAEGTEGETGTEGSEGAVTGDSMVSFSVNYYDDVYTDDGMYNRITIKDKAGAGEGEAYFTSTGYTTEVSAEKDATSLLGIVLPQVEKDGYFFMDWSMEISGTYDETTQEVSLGDGWTAGDLVDTGGLSFIAYFEKALSSNIIYDFTGGTMDGHVDTYSYTVMQPDIDTIEFEEPVTTSVPVQDGLIFTSWQMDVGYQSWYDEETGMIHGYFEEGSENILHANWRDENTVSVTYMISPDYEGLGEINAEETTVTYYESQTPEPVVIDTPDVTVTEEGWFFNGWYCPELADMPQTTFELFYPECEVSEDGMTLIGGQNQDYTMYADFIQAREIIVSFDAGNGEEPVQNTVYQSSLDQEIITVTLPEAPVYEDYTFTGWYLENTDTIYPAGAEVEIDIKQEYAGFYAQWERELPLSYNADGGTITSTEYTTSVTLPTDACEVENVVLPVVEKDGHFFLGWELGLSSGGTYEAGTQNLQWDSSEPADTLTEIPFTAVWQEAAVSTITYDLAGGTLNGSTEPYIETMVQPTIDTNSYQTAVIRDIPMKEGYIFNGWMMQQAEGGHGKYENGVITGHWIYQESYTMVAQWRPENTITITPTIADGFENAGTIDSAMGGTYGESTNSDENGYCVVTLTEVKDVNQEYLFAGWKLYEASGTAVIVDGYVDIEDYDGTVISCYPAGTSLSIAYLHDGYNVGGNNKSYILEAQFKKAATVNVTFDLNGGSSDMVTSAIAYQREIGENAAWITIPEAPVKDGYAFVGWSLDNASYAPGEMIGVDPTLDEVTFVAEWGEEEITLPLTYVLEDGSIISEEYTTEVTLLATATSAEVRLPEAEKEGYFFEGWDFLYNEDIYFEAGAQYLVWDESTPAYMLDELQLTARWIEKEKTVITYELNGGSINNSTVALTQEFTQTEKDELSFSEAILTDIPVKDGYFFVGWLLSATDESSCDGVTLNGYYGTDYTLTAQYTERESIQITYDLNGGTGLENLTETIAQSTADETTANLILPETVPTKEGYVFVGWLCNMDNGIYKAGTTAECAFDQQTVKFTAQWEETEYTIDFIYDTDGGTITSTDYTQSVQLLAMANTAEAVELPSVSKDGYFFKYWKLSNNDTEEYQAGTQYLSWSEDEPAYLLKGLTLKAYWREALKSVITYDLDGGVWSGGQESITQTFVQQDESTTAFGEGAVADTPEKSGFAFVGWTMDETDTSSYNQETHLISGLYGTNYTLKALWEAVIGKGTIALQAGTQYRLEEGSWTVNGDTTVYAGGNYFYVSEDGDYTFTAK